jgi:hypothetical protein
MTALIDHAVMLNPSFARLGPERHAEALAGQLDLAIGARRNRAAAQPPRPASAHRYWP